MPFFNWRIWLDRFVTFAQQCRLSLTEYMHLRGETRGLEILVKVVKQVYENISLVIG